jgi:hypothetical protein
LEFITCPGCAKTIRVPDDVLGKRAQCPFCQCHFRAPVRGNNGELSAPVLLRQSAIQSSPTLAPGFLLVIVGLFSMLMSGADIARSYADPEAFAAKTRDDFDEMAKRRESPELRDFGEFTIKWLPIARIGFFALGLMTVVGGIALVRQRYHGLAMLGSVSALFNVYYCSCVLGFPAGAWGLYVLMNPEVRALFQEKASGAA